jgi:tRNA(fMet)-specific endonuclease VapC
MLDTNICIYILKDKNDKVLRKFRKCKYGDICISSIVYSELIYGVEKSSCRERNLNNLLRFLNQINVYDYDVNASNEYGVIRNMLEKNSMIIGPMDMLIAAHAKSLNLILVTNNEREFKRVKGLKVENWVDD